MAFLVGFVADDDDDDDDDAKSLKRKRPQYILCGILQAQRTNSKRSTVASSDSPQPLFILQTAE
jgi:hypothetical protein